jgi:hypothetical protein
MWKKFTEIIYSNLVVLPRIFTAGVHNLCQLYFFHQSFHICIRKAK